MGVIFEGGDMFVDLHFLSRRLVYLSEGVCDRGLNLLRHVIEVDNLLRRLRFEAVQPIKELCHHFQSFLLASFNMFAHICLYVLPTCVIIELLELLLERNGVVEVELRSAFEHLRDSVLREVPGEGAQDVGEHEGNIIS